MIKLDLSGMLMGVEIETDEGGGGGVLRRRLNCKKLVKV